VFDAIRDRVAGLPGADASILAPLPGLPAIPRTAAALDALRRQVLETLPVRRDPAPS
jgi:hypothetical protein